MRIGPIKKEKIAGHYGYYVYYAEHRNGEMVTLFEFPTRARAQKKIDRAAETRQRKGRDPIPMRIERKYVKAHVREYSEIYF